MRVRFVGWATVVGTAAVTLATAADPRSVVSDGAGTNAVIQTTAALVTALVAVVAFGRFHVRRRTSDFFLAAALAHLALVKLVFTVVPLARDEPVAPAAVWAGALVRLVAMLLLVAAAWLSARQVDAARRSYTDQAAVVAGSVVVVTVAYVAGGRLAFGGLGTPRERLWTVSPGLAAVLVATAVAAAAAAAGFARRAGEEPADELPRWLAAAATLAAGAHAAAAATYVSTYSPSVSAADLLHLLSYAVLLGGVVREMRGYWRDRAAAVVAEERRRIARDLHDGLAQELSFVVASTRRLARRGDADLWDVCWAAERALDESRRAITALTHDTSDPLDLALTHAAEEVAGRLGTRVTFELEPVEVPDDVKEALLRIACEAIANAARHGAASRVHVRLSHDDGLRLRVSDNGRGFDPAAPPRAGSLGIAVMRDRAGALGGELTISAARPSGTNVEVVLR